MEERKAFYNRELEKSGSLFKAVSKKLNLLSLARLIIFVGGIGLAIFLFRLGPVAGISSLGFSVILFLYTVRIYEKASWEKDYYNNLVNINENELKALEGDYSCFNDGNRYIDPDHDFSHDIDLFGKNSLFQYLDRTCSEAGTQKLAAWLKDPYSLAADLSFRSQAIDELSGHPEWRQKYIATGIMNKTTEAERKKLEEWLNEKPVFGNLISARIITEVLTTINLLLLILAIAGIIIYSAVILSFLLNLLVLSFRFGKINRVHGLLSKQYRSMGTAKNLIEYFNNAGYKSRLLSEIKERFSSGYPALDSIGRLADIIRDFDFRLNMVTGVILNGMLMWDFRSVLKLEKWKKDTRDKIPGWFDDLAMIDALVSLSNYAFNNPVYSYPEISGGKEFLIAEDLGHPLIKEGERVVNNFLIEKRGVINLITGSNMSGKSTFLRTVAVNMILAMIGAPVCAGRFLFNPVKIFSSMRTSDSLSENESYFYAELKRLKRLMNKIENGEEPFFILDEILKGTNSKDKSEGSRMVIEKLVRNGATGIIATHDISLGTLENEYPHSVRNRCFEVLIEDETISFDYILRDGITTRMNAAILMRQQGIVD